MTHEPYDLLDLCRVNLSAIFLTSLCEQFFDKKNNGESNRLHLKPRLYSSL